MQLAYIHTPESKTSKQGFTIVELLIVVVVIGILAAISLVAYNGVTRNAAAATLRSDLKNASTQLDIARVQTGNYPTGNRSDLNRSEGTTLEYSSDGTTYCLSASSTKAGLISFHLDSTAGAIEDELCNGHTAPAGGEQALGNQGVVTTLAGSGGWGFADGTGTEAQFHRPHGLALDNSGVLYVADEYNHRIRKISPAGEVTTLAGSGRGYADGASTAARFDFPRSVAVHASGTVYVADTDNHRIRKISPSGEVTTFAGSTEGYADGTGTAAQFHSPYGIAVDLSGTIYVADRGNDRIRKISSIGEVTTFAGSGESAIVDGTGTAAQFHQLSSIALDYSGSVYVGDLNSIRKITPSGVVTTLAGSTFGFADGSGAAAKFRGSPGGIAVDSNGTIYVADYGNHRIRKISPSGEVTTLAGSVAGFADGTGTAAQFQEPEGIVVDASGVIYVVDSPGSRIRKIE